MATVSNVVKSIIDKQVLLQEAISRNIVSHSLLAQYIKPDIEAELGKNIKTSAVIMAIRRNAEKIKESSQKSTFHYSLGTIKTDICYVLFEESPALVPKLKDFYTTVNFKKGGILNIIQGNFEVAIITNKKYLDDLLDLLHDEKVLDTIKDLVSISLTFSGEFLYTPGVIYDVSRFLAWENINVIDFILTKTEISIIIDKKDLIKGYNVLCNFTENDDIKNQ